MMKRLLSLLLAGILIFSLFPAQVLATEENEEYAVGDTLEVEGTDAPDVDIPEKTMWVQQGDPVKKPSATPSCGKELHTHGENAGCDLKCSLEEHVHVWKCPETCNKEHIHKPECCHDVHEHGTDCMFDHEEHKNHEDSCYTNCPVHTCTEKCQIPEGGTCPNIHSHSEACVPTCEKEIHTHTDECCTAVHVHNETCTPDCGIEEHTHITDGCGLEGQCSKTEHTHGDGSTCQMVCTLAEHAHADSCYPMVDYTTWELVETVTVTFDTDGKATVQAQTFAQGETATEPTPTNDTYQFAGWYTDTSFETPFVFTEPVNDDITVYAKWLKKITVKYVTGVGERQIVHYTQTLVEGDTIEKPEDPPRGKYKLLAWYTTSSCTTEYTFNTTVTKNSTDTTIYARWKAIVTFKSNNGDSDFTREVIVGSEPDEPENISRGGCTLDGWYDSQGNKWFTENSNDAVTSDNLILSAKWLADVTLDLNYTGSADPKTETVTADTLFTAPTQPSRDGYVFAGWYDNEGNKWESGKKTVTDDITLYAKWSVIVTFSPSTVALYPGEDKSITCKVGNQTLSSTANNLRWSVSGNRDADTKINETSGVLTVGEDETASTLTVTVTGKYGSDFVDASLSVTVKPVYDFTSGTNGKWAQKSTKSLSFVIDSPYSNKVTKVLIGTKEVKDEDYTVAEATDGTTKLTLKSAAMKDLTVKKHDLTVYFTDDGKAETTFEVIKESDIPETGDFFHLPLWCTLLAVTAAAALMLKKRQA